MKTVPTHEDWLPQATRSFYCEILNTLRDAQLSFLVGGAYALWSHTGIDRKTKTLDLFIKQKDCGMILHALSSVGFRTEITDSVWLAKCFSGEGFRGSHFSLWQWHRLGRRSLV